jgi:hypothetical protein
VRAFSEDELAELIGAGEIVDSNTLATYARLKAEIDRMNWRRFLIFESSKMIPSRFLITSKICEDAHQDAHCVGLDDGRRICIPEDRRRNHGTPFAGI